MNETIQQRFLIQALSIVADELVAQYLTTPEQHIEENEIRDHLSNKLKEKYQDGFIWTPSEGDGKGGYTSAILFAQYGNRFNNLAGLPASINFRGPSGKDTGTGLHNVIRNKLLTMAWALQHGIDSDMANVLDI